MHEHKSPPANGAVGPSLRSAPTDGEIDERLDELNALEVRLAALEAQLKARREELHDFRVRYFGSVARRYAELERLEARIAEAMAQVSPDNLELLARADEARARAEEAEGALGAGADPETGGACHTPSVGLKRLYRLVAFAMHPDRSGDPEEEELRHELMVEANRAYRDGDEEGLAALLHELRDGPRRGRSAAELERLTRRLAYVRRRIETCEQAIEEIVTSELYAILRTHEAAARDGRDLLGEKMSELDRAISRARARLDSILTLV